MDEIIAILDKMSNNEEGNPMGIKTASRLPALFLSGGQRLEPFSLEEWNWAGSTAYP